MSRLLITDLNFWEAGLSDENDIKGSGLTSFPSTALATDLDNQLFTGLKTDGNLENGFDIRTLTVGSSAGAAAASASIFGNGSAIAIAEVFGF